MSDWDDLRFVRAVAEAGTTLAACRRLGTSQSTVVRRIAGIEKELNVTLFDKRPSGYVPTDALVALRPLLDAVALAVDRWHDAVQAQGRIVSGTVRFSAPEIVLSYVLPAVLHDFRERYPEVRLELVTTDRAVDLAGGEADVALRGGGMPSGGGLFGRRLAHDRSVLVVSRTYADRHGLPDEIAQLASHPMIVNNGIPATHPLADWLLRHVPRGSVALRPDTMVATLAAVRSGLGVGTLPRFLADRDESLLVVPIEIEIPSDELWILAHERSRGNGPTRQFMDFVSAYVLATNSSAARSGD